MLWTTADSNPILRPHKICVFHHWVSVQSESKEFGFSIEGYSRKSATQKIHCIMALGFSRHRIASIRKCGRHEEGETTEYEVRRTNLFRQALVSVNQYTAEGEEEYRRFGLNG